MGIPSGNATFSQALKDYVGDWVKRNEPASKVDSGIELLPRDSIADEIEKCIHLNPEACWDCEQCFCVFGGKWMVKNMVIGVHLGGGRMNTARLDGGKGWL